MKSISTFSIQKLFGLYDYKIAFQDNNLILIGENGSGKTTIMNVLFYFLTKQWEELVSINFNSISIKRSTLPPKLHFFLETTKQLTRNLQVISKLPRNQS